MRENLIILIALGAVTTILISTVLIMTTFTTHDLNRLPSAAMVTEPSSENRGEQQFISMKNARELAESKYSFDVGVDEGEFGLLQYNYSNPSTGQIDYQWSRADMASGSITQDSIVLLKSNTDFSIMKLGDEKYAWAFRNLPGSIHPVSIYIDARTGELIGHYDACPTCV